MTDDLDIYEAEHTGGQETDRDWSQAQDWKGMDGATAWLLINRHADGWGDTRAMMEAWLAANAEEAVRLEREGAFEAGWRTAANWMEHDDLIADIGSAAYIADRDAAIRSRTAVPAKE